MSKFPALGHSVLSMRVRIMVNDTHAHTHGVGYSGVNHLKEQGSTESMIQGWEFALSHFRSFAGLGIRSFAHPSFAHLLIRSFHSNLMSDCERFAPIAQDK